MKYIVFFIIFFMTFSQSFAKADTEGSPDSYLPKTEKTKHYSTYFSDIQGSVSIMPHQGQEGLYYIHFYGFDSRMDNKTKLYIKENLGTTDPNKGFQYRLLGTQSIHFRFENKTTMINGSEVPVFQVLLSNKRSVNVFYQGEVDLYKARSRIARYNDIQNLKVSKIEARRDIRKALTKLNNRCNNQSTEADIDWNSFLKKNQKTAPGMIVAHIKSLHNICNIGPDSREFVNTIKKIKLVPSDKETDHTVEMKGSTLLVKFDERSPNIADTSYLLIEKLMK